jgi:DNA-binding transcriptional ArsR family regulator
MIVPLFLPKEPSPKDILLTAVLYALSDEVRLGIIRQLAERGESPCGVFEIDRPKSSLSHHFRVLRESGLVSTRRSGTVLLNTLRREEIETRFPGLISAVLEEKPATRRKPRRERK